MARAQGDIDLYRSIAQAVRSGEGYYHAAERLHRAHNYPTRPFFVVRSPVLAYTEAALGDTGLRILAGSLTLLGCALWMRRLGARRGAVASLLLLATAGPLASSAFIHVHDFWAGLLLAIALSSRGTARVWWGAGAAAVREITLPFLGLLVLRRQRQAMLALGLVLAGYAVHASLVQDTGLASQGWRGDPTSMLANLRTLTFGQLLPDWLFIPLLVAPLLGWYRDRQAFAWFAWFFLFDAIFARPDNSYWLLNLVPAWFAGLALIALDEGPLEDGNAMRRAADDGAVPLAAQEANAAP